MSTAVFKESLSGKQYGVGLAVVGFNVIGVEVVGVKVVRDTEGLAVGVSLGDRLGLAVGLAVGLSVGDRLGLAVGLAVGLSVGDRLGLAVGLAVGFAVVGFGSPIMHAPLICPPKAPLQHFN